MKNYFVFVIQGYDDIVGGDNLTNVVTFEMIATDYKTALDKAKLIHPKKNYRLSMVIEKFKK